MTPVGWQGLLKSQLVPQWMPLPQGTCSEGPQFSVAALHSPCVLPSSLSPKQMPGFMPLCPHLVQTPGLAVLAHLHASNLLTLEAADGG